MIDFTRAFDLLWVDGLILKLMKLNINGNILNWIKSFLTQRKSQIKIEEDLSHIYTCENGTPQGSAISPVLFLIMINDFPKLSKFTSDAFFADDCTIWRSGKNIQQIIFHLQKDLDEIGDWCKKWGFQINTDKTVGIVFSKKKNFSNQIHLKIQGKDITFMNSVKLLGVKFDSHMTWEPHIQYIVDKSKGSLNIMRCISGTSWGATKDILLTIYKSLILSHLDYCCFVYANCSKTNQKKLDSIQYKALILATGGMKGTALKALLGECGELPLHLRREKILINYLLKISNNPRNSAQKILMDKNYYQLEKKCKSEYNITLNKFLSEVNIELDTKVTSYKDSPWQSNENQVDLTLLNNISNTLKNSEEYINFINDAVIEIENKFKYVIYADGSVKPDGKVGAAIFSCPMSLNLQFKLLDNLSVYYAEAYAILKALDYVTDNNLDECCIVSDCSKVLQDIKNLDLESSRHPALITKISNIICCSNENKISLKWLPGHCSNFSSQYVDCLAKTAATLSFTPNLEISHNEAVLMVDDWIWSVWEKKWKSTPTCNYQMIFKIKRNVANLKLTRRKQVIITRLRLLQNKLNAGLFKIGCHETGRCLVCDKTEDTCHLLFECKNTEDLRKNLRVIPNILEHWEINELLSNIVSVNIIADYIINKNIDI
jgi:ribonuclease HI